MKKELDPLAPEALAVLGALRPIDRVPEGSRDRILRAVEARVALVAATPGLSSRQAGAPARTGLASWVARSPWLSLSAALGVGAVIGAGARGTPGVRVVSVPTPIPAVSAIVEREPSPSSAGAWTTVPSASLPLAPSAHPAPSTPPLTAPSGQDLAAESALLDIARTSIARGEPDHALAAIERHATTFPHGVLREEREALGVKALVMAGRGADARARAAQFRARYPSSLFVPAIESSLRSIP